MCLVCATQSYNAIKGVYGNIDTNKIISSITHIAFLRVGEAETDKFASEYFGKQIINEPSFSKAPYMGAKSFIKPDVIAISWKEESKPLFELGYFKSLNKIGDTGLLGAVIDCDGMFYEVNLTKQMIGDMMPPPPTAAMLLENEKPQDEDTLRFKPLTKTHLQELSLHCLIKNNGSVTQSATQHYTHSSSSSAGVPPTPEPETTSYTFNIDDVDFTKGDDDDEDFEGDYQQQQG